MRPNPLLQLLANLITLASLITPNQRDTGPAPVIIIVVNPSPPALE